jgi:hypothetical protein
MFYDTPMYDRRHVICVPMACHEESLTQIVFVRVNCLPEFHDRNIHTYHSRFISEEVAAASQLLLRDAYVLPTFLTFLLFFATGIDK